MYFSAPFLAFLAMMTIPGAKAKIKLYDMPVLATFYPLPNFLGPALNVSGIYSHCYNYDTPRRVSSLKLGPKTVGCDVYNVTECRGGQAKQVWYEWEDVGGGEDEDEDGDGVERIESLICWDKRPRWW